MGARRKFLAQVGEAKGVVGVRILVVRLVVVDLRCGYTDARTVWQVRAVRCGDACFCNDFSDERAPAEACVTQGFAERAVGFDELCDCCFGPGSRVRGEYGGGFLADGGVVFWCVWGGEKVEEGVGYGYGGGVEGGEIAYADSAGEVAWLGISWGTGWRIEGMGDEPL